MMIPNRTHPAIFKRGGAVLPNGTSETTFFMLCGELLAISFNRPPHSPAPEMIVHRLSDQCELARWPWPGGFGAVIVDAGVIHIFGSSNPGEYRAGNWVLHSTLDPVTFQPSTPQHVWQAEVVPGGPYTVPNVGVCKSPVHGYVMSVDYMSSPVDGGDSSQARTIFLKAQTLCGPWTRFGEPFVSNDQNMVGGFKPFHVPGGAHPNRCYMLYISGSGWIGVYPKSPYWMNIAYTDDFQTFHSYDGNGVCYVFPDCPIYDGINSSDGSQPVDLGNGTVLIPYFAGDQQTWSAAHLGRFDGSLSDLIEAFGF